MADDAQMECDTEVCDDDYVMVLPQDFGLQSPIVQQPPMFALEDVVISDDLNSVSPAPSSNKHLLPEDDDVPWQDFIEDKYLSDSSPDIGKGCVVIAPDDYGPVSKDIEGVGVCLAALEIQPSTMKRGRRQQRKRTCRRTNLEPPRCRYCNKTFPRPRELNRHVKRHERPVRCVRCLASMAERRDLNRHYQAFHPKFAQRELGLRPVGPILCDFCDTTFTRRDNKMKHIRRFH